MSGSPISVIFFVPLKATRPDGKQRYQRTERHILGVPRKHDGIFLHVDGDSVRYSVDDVYWRPARGGCGRGGAPLVPVVTLRRIAE